MFYTFPCKKIFWFSYILFFYNVDLEIALLYMSFCFTL